ncbi:MAG: hypothetical protein H6734_26180 [Alphaproteobacteria bacterium]|nr:hypothetical protein [Alphaproteobacteria bacterium]
MIISLVSAALANPFVLSPGLPDEPSHSYLSFMDTTASESFVRSGIAGPPAGTTSVDIEIALNSSFGVLSPPPGASLTWRAKCDWGSSTVNPAQVVPESGMTLTFDPEDLDVNSTFTKVVVTAAGGDFFAVRAFGTLAGGEQLRSVRLQAPISASPSDAGTGFCIFEVVASGSGEDAFADQPLLLPIDPVSEFASDLRSIAEEAYADRFGGRDTPDDDTIAAELQPLVDALADGGCTQFPVVQKILAGAYDKTVLTGEDDDGDLSGTQDLGTRTFGATLGDGTLAGSAASLFSAQTSGRKLFAETEGGGFVAGRWKRVKGTRGVFYGVSGVCDGANDAPTALAGWFDGPLP